jgi:parallel beta-helix repeat protein
MKPAFILVAVICIPALAFSTTIYVPDDYATIQQAFDAAVNGDTIIVRAGTYFENIDFKGKAINVVSEQGATATVIDGNQIGAVVNACSNEGPDSVLNGFTVTNGYGVSDGGGIFCNNSNPTITNNIISGNTAKWGGGGISCNDSSSPTITNNTIAGNSADMGGGIHCSYYSSPTITNNTITGNSTAWRGGGIHCDLSSPIITNNILSGNSADFGGGIFSGSSSPSITNNTISGNTAAEFGGGIMSYFISSPTITNTILWDNDASEGPEIWIGYGTWPSSLTISYSNVKGGQESVYVFPNCILNWGTGMIDADPLFVDSDNDDFHLTFPSPCKDTGDNLAVTEANDFEGDPRIAYGTVDMGAEEFYTHLYWTGDAAPGGNVEIKLVGLPGTSPVVLWVGSGVLGAPISTKYGDWYLQFPLLANVGLGSIPVPDGVYILPLTFPPDTPTPLSLPCQAGIGVELTNLSVMNVQ